MRQFESLSMVIVPGRGIIRTVRCDGELPTPGEMVELDGKAYRVRSVEYRSPFRSGDVIGLAAYTTKLA